MLLCAMGGAPVGGRPLKKKPAASDLSEQNLRAKGNLPGGAPP